MLFPNHPKHLTNQPKTHITKNFLIQINQNPLPQYTKNNLIIIHSYPQGTNPFGNTCSIEITQNNLQINLNIYITKIPIQIKDHPLLEITKTNQSQFISTRKV